MSKKFILFIVEGTNDRREINAMLHTPYFADYKDKYEIHFRVIKSDLTTDPKNTAKNIQKALNGILMDFRNKGIPYHNIKVQEIQEIVHVVDLDGAFIPKENIKCGEDAKFTYTDNFIITKNYDGAVGRNKRKAEILRKLISIDQIGNVPYSVYYVSRDMDHLLFNKRYSPPEKKYENSVAFMRQCEENPEILFESVFKLGIATENGYLKSWHTVQNGCESLHRHTNFNLFFGSNAKNQK